MRNKILIKGKEEVSEEGEQQIENKFRKLEIKTREFEKKVLLYLQVKLDHKLQFQKNKFKSTQFKWNENIFKSYNGTLKNSYLVKKEQRSFLLLLVEVYLKYMNNLVIFIDEIKVYGSINKNDYYSPWVMSCCALAFPFVSCITTGKMINLNGNIFYHKVKRIALNMKNKNYFLSSFLLKVCYYIEFSQGHFDLSSQTNMMGIKLLHSTGITSKIPWSVVFKFRNHQILDQSILWLYWNNCELVGTTNSLRYVFNDINPPKLPLFNLSELVFPVDNEEEELINLKLLYNFQLISFDFITKLQHTLSNNIKLSLQVKKQSLELYKVMYDLRKQNYNWFKSIDCLKQSILLKKNFFSISCLLALNQCHLFLFTKTLSFATQDRSSMDFKVSKEFPSIKEISIELLEYVHILKKAIPFKDTNLPNDSFMLFSITFVFIYYYGCTVYVQDFSSEGSLLFLKTLEALRTLSNFWGAIDVWIPILLQQRKELIPNVSPPLKTSKRL